MLTELRYFTLQLGLAGGNQARNLWIVICHPGEGSRLANGYLKLLEREAMLHFGRVDPVCQGKAVFQAILAHACRSAFLDDGVRRIIADPPVNLKRDTKRFLCSFQVDGHRRLLVTVLDNLSGKTLLKDHPVVRL